MRVKRLNFRLAIVLPLVALALGGGISLLHGYQVTRTAQAMLSRAARSLAKGDRAEALRQYRHYVNYVPTDHAAFSQYALLVSDDAEQSPKNPKVQWQAYFTLEQAARRDVNNLEVLRRLVDSSLRVGRFADAIKNLQRLIKAFPKDASLQRKLAVCHIAMEQYSQAVTALQAAIKLDPTNVAAYAELSNLYRSRLDEPKQAEAILQQLITANSRSSEAYLARGEYWMRARRPDQAKQDIQRAAELAPDNLNVLLAQAELASATNQLDEAQRQLTRAGELFPDNDRVLRASVDLRLRRNQPQAAIKLLSAAAAKQPQAPMEQVRLMELRLDTGDIEGARSQLKQLQDGGCPPVILKYLEARLLMADGKWLVASHQLQEVRPQIASQPRWVLATDLALGACYERLGLPDLQLQAFQRVLVLQPSHFGARIGCASALLRSGKTGRALQEYRQLRQGMGDKAFLKVPQLAASLYRLLLHSTRQQPSQQRDWSEVNQLIEALDGVDGVDPVQLALMRAEALVAQDRSKEAYALIAAKCKEDPKQVRYWVELANLTTRLEGPQKSLEVLDDAGKQLGDVLLLRLSRADRATRLDRDKAQQILQQLAGGVGKLPPAEQAALLQSLGIAYYRLQDRSKAQQFWRQAAEVQPENAQLRLLLFELAREMGDEKGMEEACQQIKRLLGSQSAEWGYVEAARRVWMARSADNAPQLLEEAVELVRQAQRRRPDWSDLSRLEAEIAAGEGRLDDAIVAFQRARDLGLLQPHYLAQFARLLYARQRFEEARQLVASVENVDLVPELKQIKAELELRSGDVEAAAKTAQAVVATSKKADDFVWYGQLLLRAKKGDDATAAFRRAVELDAQSSQARLFLILSLNLAGKSEQAKAEVEKMHGSLAPEDLPLALGQAYQLMGERQQAEQQYRAAVAAKPEDLGLLLRLATFYRQSAQGDRGQIEKASKELHRVIDLASRDPKTNAVPLATARRMLAEVSAQSGDWRERQKALDLLEQNIKGGNAAPADLRVKAAVLAASLNRASQLKAIELLEQLKTSASALSVEEQLRLASLYEANGQWPACRAQLLDLLATRPEAPHVIMLLQLLFRHEATPQEIAPWVDKLASLRPDEPVTAIMQARLLAKRGQTAQAVAKLEAAVPRPVPDDQLARLASTALVLEDLQQLDKAKQLLEEYAQRKPEGKMALAQFLARHNETDRAMQLCESAVESHTAIEVIAVALNVLRQEAQGGQAVPKHVALVDSWLQKALAAKDMSTKEQLQGALLLTGLRELQGRRDDLIQLYGAFLDRKDLTDVDRAPIWNNLAFVLAAGKHEGTKALELANQAIAVLGPAPELLDTRAVAHLAAGQPTEAIADAREAIEASPNGLKYFHLALAQAAAGDRTAAEQALKTARQKYQLTATQIPPLERHAYEQLAKSLKDSGGL